jgi:hypothetical protein
MKIKSIKNIITTTFVAATAVGAMSAYAIEYKHVAVSPEQIDSQKLTAADAKGLFSHSTMLPIYSSAMLKTQGKMAGAGEIEQKIHLDGAMDAPIVLLTPDASQWFVSVTNAQGQMIYNELAAPMQVLAVNDVNVGPQSFKGKVLSLKNVASGEYTVKLTHKSETNGNNRVARKGQKDVAAYLLFKGDTELQAYSYLDNNFTTKGSDINVVAKMVDTRLNRGERSLMVKKEALMGTIDSAVATITSPSGKSFTLTMNDRGIGGDKVAGDGLFGAKVPTDEVGVYTNQIQIRGRHTDGKRYSRTTTDIYPIAPASFEFIDAGAMIKIVGDTSAKLSVPVKRLDDSERVYLSAEIWGTNADGEQEAATWVGGIVEPQGSGSKVKLDLSFDTRWISRKGLQAPYSLKSVRLQNADNNVPVAQRGALSLVSPLAIKPTKEMTESTVARMAISQNMLMNKAPAIKATSEQSAAAPTGGPALLLVHGYCSSQAWKESDFYHSAEFKDYKQSISHDTFAQRVANFGSAYSSYGIVAHSQGGAAALTLYSRYISGLDSAGAGSLIQSVGTPYQGTALAGNLAAIGDVFGAGCGKNTDLTYSGASNWLATVPSWAKAKVEYYTTSFDTAWWSYDYCHLATDLFLDDPEDGTTEKWSGQLSGAINKGHKKGQCHTSGMRDPAQTKDSSRNATMSSRAAR